MLASQNQAVSAIDEYQVVIGDETVDPVSRGNHNNSNDNNNHNNNYNINDKKIIIII